MKKKRAKPFGGDPMMVTKHATWGTKAQAKINERERGYKNRIHELETACANYAVAISNVVKVRDRLQRVLDSVLSPRHLGHLRNVCMLPLRTSIELGIDDDLGRLCVWLHELENPDIRGNVAAAIVQATMDKVENVESRPVATLHPVGVADGITKVRPDHDDATSIDDLFAKCVDVHLERMDKDYYWLGITPAGGETVHIDITRDKKGPGHKNGIMRARLRK